MELGRYELAERIEKIARSAFEGGRLREPLRTLSWTATTKLIKKVFGDLGKQLGYHVAASGYPLADDREWLYDMCWYTVLGNGVFSQLAMVLESELKPGGSVANASEIDGDFQKLVQARAEVRVWVALVPNPEMTARHIENCKNQARAFAGAMPGDIYVFIIYDWTTNVTIVERLEIDISTPLQIST